MSTIFSYSRGTAQGRITSGTAPDGSYVFELGHLGGRTQMEAAIGDYAEISQSISPDSQELLARCTVNVIEPTEEVNVGWDVVGYVGGTEIYRRRLEPYGRSITLSDIGLSLMGAGSPVTVAFRLEAVTP